MAGSKICRVCRAILTSSDEARSPETCPYCGAETELELDRSNPYSPPRENPGAIGDASAGASDIPPTLPGKLRFAFKLFVGDFPLMAALVLSAWLPGNILASLILRAGPLTLERQLDFHFSRLMIEAVFGPIYTGGILYILANRMTGDRSDFVEAIQVGIHNWLRLFGARFITGFLLLPAFIPILWFIPGSILARHYVRRDRLASAIIAFILPGFVLAVRYALIDPVVVLEGAEASESRFRSTELARGKGAGIFIGGGLFLILVFVLSESLRMIAESYPVLGSFWVVTAFNCIVDLSRVLSTCFLFTYFWEGHLQKPASLESRPRPFSGLDDIF